MDKFEDIGVALNLMNHAVGSQAVSICICRQDVQDKHELISSMPIRDRAKRPSRWQSRKFQLER